MLSLTLEVHLGSESRYSKRPNGEIDEKELRLDLRINEKRQGKKGVVSRCREVLLWLES